MIVLDAIFVAALLVAMAIGTGFLVLPVLYVIERASGVWKKPDPEIVCPPDDKLPNVLVQLPIFNESDNVAGLLRSVAALDWPRDKLQIQLLDDSSDWTPETAAIAIAQLRASGLRVEHLRRPHRGGYKAGALAAGLAASDAPFVAMLDADYRPPPNWLRVIIPRFALHPRAGFVQSRCEFTNSGTNWLTRVQSLLFDAHFVMEQGVRARAGILFQFNGTGGIWRRAAIDAAGGWLDDSLCEDLDLTIRAALAGWRGVFSMSPPVVGLVPDRIRHWRVQQRRWASGFAQIARKLSGPLWRSDWPPGEKLLAGFLILYQSFFPAIALAAAALLIDIVLRAGGLPPVVPLLEIALIQIILVAVGMTLPPYIELRRGTLGRYLCTVIALPPLILYLSLANARPMVAAFFGRTEVFKRTPKAAAK